MGHRIAIGTIAGIEVRLHRSWAIIALLIAWSFWNRVALLGYGATPAVLMAVALLFFLSLLLHEFAHALEAQHRGVEVRGITLFLFGGVTELAGDIRRPRDEFALRAIGPFSSIVLAAVFGLVAVYTGRFGLASVAQVAGLLGWINLALGVFDLLPGAPLDGGRILRALVWAVTGDRQRALRFAARAGQLIGALIASFGLLQLLLVPGALLVGIWFVVIGGFLAFAAQSEIAQQSIDEALGGLTVGVLLLDDVAQLESDQRAGRAVAEVMVPVHELRSVDHRSEITDALSEMADRRPLAVTSHEDGQERIEGVVAPEQLQRSVRRTLQLSERQQARASADGTADGRHLPEGGR